MIKRNIFILFMMIKILISTVYALEIKGKNKEKIEFSGSFRIQNDFNSFGNAIFNKHNEIINQTNLNIIGEKEIFRGITGFGNFEMENSFNHSKYESYSKSNLTCIGLDLMNLGKIEYGKSYIILYDVKKWTNPIKDRIAEETKYPFQGIENLQSNLLTYRKNFGNRDELGLSFQYCGKRWEATDNAYDSGFGFSANYDVLYGLKVGLSHLDIGKFRFSGTDNRAIIFQDMSFWNAGMKYKDKGSNFYISAVYEDMQTTDKIHQRQKENSRKASDTKSFNFIMQCISQKISLKPFLGFSKIYRTHFLDNFRKNLTKDCIYLGISYQFDKNLTANFNYQMNITDFQMKEKVPSNATFGIEYRF